jgi:hypothetical protein
MAVKRKVLLPVYLCNSVPFELQARGWEVCYYDLDPLDLNADINSLDDQISFEKPEAVLVASMYGNPANLMEIQALCKYRNVMMIDDAAQSIGSSLNGQCVGSFGDAGFFSLSPGKPISGALGAFYWVAEELLKLNSIEKYRPFLHGLGWLDYYIHRQGAYTIAWIDPYKIISKIRNFAFRQSDMLNDRPSQYEEKWLGGAINGMLSNQFAFRNHGYNIIKSSLEDITCARLISPLRGDPHPHKAVLVLKDIECAQLLRAYLTSHRVKSLFGYELLSYDKRVVPNAVSISGKVLELPIEQDEVKMHHLASLVNGFLKSY